MHILVAEDDAHIRNAIARVLSASGHEVTGAGTGLEVKRLLDAGDIDIALIDINLPDVTGWDVVRSIRAMSMRQPAVIVMSAVQPRAATIREFLPVGVLLKPFPIPALRHLIDKAEQRQRGELCV